MKYVIAANLQRAAFDRESVTIGGGMFGPDELREAGVMLAHAPEILATLAALSEYAGDDPDKRHPCHRARALLARLESKGIVPDMRYVGAEHAAKGANGAVS